MTNKKGAGTVKVSIKEWNINAEGELRVVIGVKGFEADEHGKITDAKYEEEVVLNKKMDTIFRGKPIGGDPRMSGKL